MARVLGIDVGGANLKAAHTDGSARSMPFALWKAPQELTAALRDLLAAMPPYELLAITMTGELCDCFPTKADGVHAILTSVAEANRGAGEPYCQGIGINSRDCECSPFPPPAQTAHLRETKGGERGVGGEGSLATPVAVWSAEGRFLSVEEAYANPLSVAAANWLAQAVWAGRLVREGPAILIDMGSTTTDVIPLLHGHPMPQGRTDAERLESGELIYMGWRRTPVAAILGIQSGLMAEFFASTLDALLLSEIVAESALRRDPSRVDCDTADGRPATRAYAHARLARMLGHDAETATLEQTRRLASNVVSRMRALLATSLDRCRARLAYRTPATPQAPSEGPWNVEPTLVLSGSGEAVLGRFLGERPSRDIVSLGQRLGSAISEAACAYAVAVLAAESNMGRRP